MTVPRDVPVQVAVVGDLRQALTTWLENDVGWQVVTGRGALPPLGVITDDPAGAGGAVVLVDGRRPAHERDEVLRTGLRAGALDVVSWPQERDRLVTAVLDGAAGPSQSATPVGRRSTGAGDHTVRIGGATGGAGTSTVALALGAWAAWNGARALVVGGDDLIALTGAGPWEGPGSAEIAALPSRDAGREASGLARAVPGVAGLALLGGGGRAVGGCGAWPFDLVVLDVGSEAAGARLLIGSVDRRLLAFAGRRTRLLVRVADGAGRRTARRLLGGDPRGWLPEDARVARAGLAGTVPGALPGRWLAGVARAIRGGVVA